MSSDILFRPNAEEIAKKIIQFKMSEQEYSSMRDEEVFRLEEYFSSLLSSHRMMFDSLPKNLLESMTSVLDGLFDEANVRRAREDPNAFMEYVFVDDVTGEPTKQSRIHREIQRTITEKKQSVIIIPRQHGKCLMEGTLIDSCDGKRTAIENFSGGLIPALNPTTLLFDHVEASKSFFSGEKECFEITTSSGRKICASATHPFLKNLSWIEVASLKVGDRIGIMYGCEPLVPSNSHSDDNSLDFLDGYALGIFVGNGATGSGNAYFSTAEEFVVSQMTRWSESYGWRITQCESEKYGYRVVELPYHGEWGSRRSGPKRFIREHHLKGKGSYEKRIPDEIWTSDRDTQVGFISGYFDTDCYVNHLDNGSADFSSVNPDLLIDLQALLARYRINGVFAKKNGQYNGEPHVSWRLTIRGESLIALFHLVRSSSQRAKKLSTLMDFIDTRDNNGAGNKIDLIPFEIWKPVVKNTGLRLRQLGVRVDTKRSISRTKVRKIAVFDENDQMMRIADSNVIWDSIVSIQSVGVRKTYDLSVPGYENFIANGFITHNSTQLVGRSLWELGKNQNTRIKIVSNTDTEASKRVLEMQMHIENNKKLLRVFPNMKPSERGRWNSNRFYVERSRVMREPSVEGYGVLSSGTGGRCDILVLDDVVDRKNALTQPSLRRAVKDAVRSDWFALLSEGGRAISICTLWHKEDLNCELGGDALKKFLNGGIPDQTCLPDGAWYVMFEAVGEDCEPVWPEKWSKEKLEEIRQKVGRSSFNRGWRNRVVDDTETIIDTNWISYYEKNSLPPRKELFILQSYDLAISQTNKKDNSWFACVTLAAHLGQLDPKIFVIDAFHRRITFPEQIRVVHAGYQAIKPDGILLESNAYQAALYQQLMDTSILPIFPTFTKVNKRVRLQSCSPSLEGGHVLFSVRLDPEKNHRISERGNLVAELTEFPFAESDDLTDAFSQGVRYLQEQWTILQNYNEQRIDGEANVYTIDELGEPPAESVANDIPSIPD